MKKLIYLAIMVFLIVMALKTYAISGDVNLGLATFNDCGYQSNNSILIFYDAFNQSDSYTLQNALTGQAIVKSAGNASINDSMLLLDSGDVYYSDVDLRDTLYTNYTRDVVFRRQTHSGYINNWFGHHNDAGGLGNENARYGTISVGNNWELFLVLNEAELAPSVSALSKTDTTWLFRFFYSSLNNYVNVTLYNITGTSGNYALTQIASRQVIGYSNLDTVQSITWREATDTTLVNVTEDAIYVGRDCRNLVVSPPDTSIPIFTNQTVNITNPRTNFKVNFSIRLNDSNNVSGFIFSWDNATGVFRNDSFISLKNYGLTIANVSFNKTIQALAGGTIRYQWYANDTNGNMGNSSVFTLLVAGTSAPNVTINSNNFFNKNNKSIIGLNQSQRVFLNLTFLDDISLFGFEFNITNSQGTIVLNFTNISLSGTVNNFTMFINVTRPQGYYNASITAWDSHTAMAISDFKIDKWFNYIQFDDEITITAEGAIWANTEKSIDRYSFEFDYLPGFLAPNNKVFIIESNSGLIYIQESDYQGHFVDWKNKKWVDFEGIEGKPIITKINEKKYKIEFANSDSKVIFNSIGGLNSHSTSYQYYISNVSIDWLLPEQKSTTFSGTSFSISLNITGNGRNFTRIYLYNSTRDLMQTANLTANGTETYFYNATFSGLTDIIYYVNATHTDISKENSSSETLTFTKISLADCNIGGFPAINFTIKDEGNSSRVKGTFSSTFRYNGTSPAFSTVLSGSNQDNFSICITPANERLTGNYEVSYSASGYPSRNYDDNDAIYDNNTQLINLFLLQSSDGIYATFNILDSFQNPLTNVLSTMKSLANVTLEVRETDDAGIVTFFVDPDITYTFTFSKTGYTAVSKNLRITSSDIITITMEAQSIEQTKSYATGISYFFKPSNTVLKNDTTYNFVFNMTSSFWNITGCTLYLKNMTTALSQSSSTFNGSQCIIDISFFTGNQSTIISEAIYQLNGTTNNTISVQYKIQWTYTGQFSLKTFLDDIKTFGQAGFNDFTRFILAIIISFAVVGYFSLEIASFREPEVLIVMTWLMVLFFSYLGWMNISFETIPSDIRGLPANWLNQWIVFILTTLGGGSYIIRKNL